MTVLETFQKDFQEIFPTIIGDKEPKLSIDDLMETSFDYIIKELHNSKEFDNPSENIELISLLNILAISDLDIDFDSHTYYRLKRLSEKHPDQASFRFFLYRYLLSTSFNNEEYSLESVTHLINRIIADTLFELTDFVTLSGFGDSIISLNEVSDELLSILKDAVPRYPQKITLLWITAHLYRVQNNYQESIRYNKLFLEKHEALTSLDSKEEIDLDFVDADAEQMVCFQLADLHFNVGEYSKALNYCNRVLDQGRGGVYSENIKYYFFDTLIIRIRIHMVSDNKSAFKKDYAELLKVISEEELRENYSDIVDYSKQLKL